ncbi:hypothetical protein PInf_017191 [Phytophthora infestans]|nr:hypothetical protein PInf_017191 [Phytophthora infestans]
MALATTLSISGGVTIFLSIVLSFGYSVLDFTKAFEPEHLDGYNSLSGKSWTAATICMGAGIMVVYGVDFIVQKLAPSIGPDTPKEISSRSETRVSDHASVHDSISLESPPDQGFVKMDEAAKEKLQRMGILSGIAIALHNIPSGIATFTAGIEDPAIGLSMAIGVGLHNIAEGVAVAAPVYFATGSKCKGIMWCIVAAIAEHVGAFIALGIIRKDDNDFAQAALYGVISGMMSTITMKEIFPTAYTYANGRIHLVSNGALMGMVLMSLSLYFFSSPSKAPSAPLTGMRSPTKIRTPTKLVRSGEARWASKAKDVKKKLLGTGDNTLDSAWPPPKRVKLSTTLGTIQSETQTSASDANDAVEESQETTESTGIVDDLHRQVQVAQCLEEDLLRDNARMRLKVLNLRDEVGYYYSLLGRIELIAADNSNQEQEQVTQLASQLQHIVSGSKSVDAVVTVDNGNDVRQ